MYLAILTGTIIILPHIIWLFKNEFFSFAYMSSQAVGSADGAESVPLLRRLFFPLKFSFDQIFSILPCAFVYAIIGLQAKNISINKTTNDIQDKCFIFFITVIPILTQGLMGTFTGNLVHGIWGSIMISFTGLFFFYFLPIKFNEKSFSFFVKCISICMILWLSIIIIFSQLQAKYKVSYPYQTIHQDFDKIWANKTNNAPLKYVTGNIAFSSPFRIYDKNRPTLILETFGHKNPWVDYDDIQKSGAIAFEINPNLLIKLVKETFIFLPEDYKFVPQKYTYKITNKLGKSREYEFYYTIILPNND